MFQNYNYKKYTKLDTNVARDDENNENLPANFQNEAKSIDCKKEDSVSELFTNFEDVSKISQNLSCGDGNYSEREENKNEQSASPSTEFCDAECGEPTTSQCLTIDFTISNDDTEFSQQKCCDFWKFIHTIPDLKDLMVIPETTTDEEETTIGEEYKTSKQTTAPHGTAIEALERAAEGPAPWSFAAKETSLCKNKNFPNYCYGSCVDVEKTLPENRKTLIGKGDNTRLPTIDVQPSRKNFLSRLCAQMNAWDLEHPKSFDPPQRVPPISTESESAQFLSSAPTSRFCPSDGPCVTCQPKALVDLVDLVKKEE